MNSRIFTVVKSAILITALTTQIFSQETDNKPGESVTGAQIETSKPADDKSKNTKGLVYESGDVNVKIGALVQALGQFNINDPTWEFTDNFRTRRVRPSVEGKVAKFVGFKVVPDFAASTLVLQDTYVDVSPATFFNIRVGKTKTPYGLSFLQSIAGASFFENDIASNLAPRRDVGILLFGKAFSDIFEYQLGAFNGTPDGNSNGVDTDIDDSKDVAARIFINPFKTTGLSFLEGFGLGIAGTYGLTRGINPVSKTINTASVSTFKTSGKAVFFSYNNGTGTNAAASAIYLSGIRYRYSPQLAYYVGPLGIIGEYFTTVQDLQKVNDKLQAQTTAWNVTVSFVLTGQKNSYKGVKVGDDFDFSSGNIGTVELALRYGALNFDEALFTNSIFADTTKSATGASSLGVAINWYINSNFRVQTNYELTTFKGGAISTVNDGNRLDEHTILAGVQVNI
jgi:phosphate-selective porin OprO/OprP